MVTQPKSNEWAMLSYRIPREPSTPRIAVWRRLKDLGVAQVVDGLVALPSSAHTREQLEWVSAKVKEADGEAIVWVATPASRREADRLVHDMNTARTQEYRTLLDEIESSDVVDSRTLARWRRELRRIDRRDHFRAELGETVRFALADRADSRSNAAIS